MIVLIGGTGFLGKHLSVAMYEKEIQGVSFSKNPDLAFLRVYAPNINGMSIDTLDTKPAIEAIESASTIVYLASNSTPANTGNTARDELDHSVKVACDWMEKVSDLNSSAHFIYVSSGGTVYGSGHSAPISETAALEPTTPYAFGKIVIENLIRLRAKSHGLRYTILRPSNPVGKWHQNLKQGIVGAAFQSIVNSQELTIFGDGLTTRDYIDADEFANAVLKVASAPETSVGKTWNVGSGIGTTVNQIMQIVGQVCDQEVDLKHAPSRSSDLEYNVLNVDHIKNDLGWEAEMDIRQILERQWRHILRVN